MLNSVKQWFAIAVLAVVALTFSACAPAAQEVAPESAEPTPATAGAAETPTQEPAAESPAEPAPAEAATAEPDAESAETPQAAEEAATAAGIYKGFFPGASSPGLDTTLYLNADNSLRLVNDYLNEEPPVVEVGTWEAQDNAVTVILTGQEDQAYTEPVTRTLTLAADGLTAEDWIGPWYYFDALATGTSPAYDAEAATESIEGNGFAGFYKMFALSASCCGRDITLLLAIDNTVRMTTDFLNGEPPIVAVGAWEDNDGSVTVTLTGQEGGADYEQPETITFALQDGMLTATEYDESQWGSDGLSFYFFPGLAQAFINNFEAQN